MTEWISFLTRGEATSFVALCDRWFGYPSRGAQTYARVHASAALPGQNLVKVARDIAREIGGLGNARTLTALERTEVATRYAARVALSVEVTGA